MTPRYISCAATAMIGSTKLFGTMLLEGGEVRFCGSRLENKRKLKDPITTLLKRLQNNKKISITAASEHFTETWNNSSSSLTNYSLSLSTSGSFIISFTLKENNDS